MLSTQLVQDISSQKFKILRSKDAVSGRAKQLSINSESQAREFVQKLRQVPRGYWRGLVTAQATSANAKNLSDREIEQLTLKLLSSGQLKVYEVHQPESSNVPVENLTVKNGNASYRFANSSSLLVNRPREHKEFHNQKEAETYLNTLKLNKDQAEKIQSGLSLKSAGVNADPLQSIIESMAAGETIVVVDNVSSAPASDAVIAEQIYTETKASLGPEAVAQEEKEEKVHLCLLNKMTLSCKHGRSVTLDPSAPIDEKTGQAKITYLAVTSLPASSPQKDQELLTAKIDVNDKCGGHTQSPYTITSDTVKLVNNNFGNVIKFYSPGEELDLSTEFYKYIWLPSIKPKSYKVIPPDFCDMTKFDGKAKSVRVDVYPEIKWDLGLEIGFGQIKATDSSPGDKQKAKENVIERKIEDEVFSVQGKAVCTHGNAAPVEFVSKFNNKFDAIKQEINGQNALLSKIFGKFQEGDNHSVTLDLPKLALSGTSSIAEKSTGPDVDIKWDYNVKAAPLIGINAKVDVLPMLLKKSGWGSLFLPLLSELKEKYANPDGSIGIKLEASIIISVSGTVDFNLNFSDSSFVHDEKNELRSLKFDVPISCTGEVKGEGHILVFSAELSVMAKINSGFAYEMFMGADASGIYRSSILHFHGLEFEVKAVIKGKMTLKGKKKKAGSSISNNSSSSRKKEYNNKWTWIKKNQVEFSKEYLIKN